MLIDIQEEIVPEAEPKTEEPVETTDEVVTEEIPDESVLESEPVGVFEVQEETEDIPEESGPEQVVSVISAEKKTVDTQEETAPEVEEHVETTKEVGTEEIPSKSFTESEPLETFEGERETEEVPEEGEPEQVVSVEEEKIDIQEEIVPETEEPVDTTDEVKEIIPDESVPESEPGEAFEGEKEIKEVPEEREQEQIVSVVSSEEEKAIDIQEETVPETEEPDEVVTDEIPDESVPESKPQEVFEEEKEAEKVPDESEPEQIAAVVSVEEKTPQMELDETTDKIVTDEILDKSAPEDEPVSEEREPEEIISVVSIEEEKSYVQVESALESERPVDKIEEVFTEESPGDGGFIVHYHEKKELETEEVVTEDIPKESLSEDQETDLLPDETVDKDVPDGIVPDQVEAIDAFEKEQEGQDTPSEEPLHTIEGTSGEPGFREECTEPFQEDGDIPEETDGREEEPLESALNEDETIDQEREVTSAMIFHERDEPVTTLEEDKVLPDSTEERLPGEQEELDEVSREEEKFQGIPDETAHPDEDKEEGLLEQEEPKEDFITEELVEKEALEEHKLLEELEKDEQELETQEEVMDFTAEETAPEDEEPIKTEDEVKMVEAVPEEIIPEQDEEVEGYEVDKITEDTVQSVEEPVEPTTEDLDHEGPREDVEYDATDQQFQDDTYAHERYFEELQNIPEEPEEVSGEDLPAKDSTDMVPEDTEITDSVVHVEETRETIVKEDESGAHTESVKTVVTTTTTRVVSSGETLMDEYPVEGTVEQEPCEDKTEEEAPKIPSEPLETFEEGKPAQEEDYPVKSEDLQGGAFTSQVQEPLVETPEEIEGSKQDEEYAPLEHEITDESHPGELVHVQETRKTIVKEDESGLHTESVRTVITTRRVVSSGEVLVDDFPVEETVEQPGEEESMTPSEPVETEDKPEGAAITQVEEPLLKTPEELQESKPDELTSLEHESKDEDAPHSGEHVHVEETRETIMKEDDSGVQTESVKTVITTTTRVVSSSKILMDEYPVEGTVEQPEEEEPKISSEPMETSEDSKPIGEEDHPMESEDVLGDVSSQVEEPFVKTPEELEESKPDELTSLEHEGKDEDAPHSGEHVHVEETRQTIMKEDDSGVQTESVKTVITTTRVVSSSEILMDEYPVEGTVEQPEEEEPKIPSEPMETTEDSKPIGEEDRPMESEDVPEDAASSQVEEPFVKTPEELEESKPDELTSSEHEGKDEDAPHSGEHVQIEETRQTIMKEDDSGVQTESVKTVITTTTRVVSSSEILMDEYPVEEKVESPEEEEPKIPSEPMETTEESKPIGEEDRPMESEDVPEDAASSQVEEPFVETPEELEESKPDVEPTPLEQEPHVEDTVQQEVIEDEEVQPQLDADEKLVTEETPEVKQDFGTNEDEVEIEMEAVEENIKTEISPDDEIEVFAPPEDLSDQGYDALGIPPGEEYFTQTTEVRIHTEITTSEGTRIHDERKVIEDGEVKVDIKVDTVEGDSEGEKLLGAIKDDGIDETQLGSQPLEVIPDEFTGQDAQKSEEVMREGSLPDDEDMSSEEGEYMPEIRVDPSSEYIQPKEDGDEPDHGTDGLLVEPDPFTEESDVSMDEREVAGEPVDEYPDKDDQLPDTDRIETIETSISHTQILQGGVVSHTETHVTLSGDTAKPSDQEPQDEEPETKEVDETPVIHDELLEQSIILESEVCLESSPREEKEEPEDRPKTPEIADITEHEEFSPYFQDQEYHQRVSDIQVPDADVEVELPEISPEDDVEMDLPEPPLHPYAEDQESDLPSREVHTSTTVITSTVRHISSGPDGSVTETSTRTVTRYEDGEKITAPTELKFEEAPPVGADSVQTPEIQELPDTPDSIPGSPLIGAAYVSQQQVLDSSFQEKVFEEDKPQEEEEPVAPEDIEIPGEAAGAPVFMDGPTESDYYDANLLVTHHQPQQDDTDRVEPDASETVQEESLDVGADQEHSAEVLDEALASQDEPCHVEVEEVPAGVDISLEQRDEERYLGDEPECQPEPGVKAEGDDGDVKRDEGESTLTAGAIGMSLSVQSMEIKSGKDQAEGIEEGVRPEEVSEEPPSTERLEDKIESEDVESEDKTRETLEESLPESERGAVALDQVYEETPQYTTQPEEYSRGDEGEETEPESEQAFAAEIAPEDSVTMESGDDILESELTEEHDMPLDEPVEEETPAKVVTEDQQIERGYKTQEVLVETQGDEVSKHISVVGMTSTQSVFRSTLLTAEGFVTEEDELADSIVKPTPPEDVEKAEGEIKTPDEEEKDEVPEVLKKTEESEQLEEGKEVDDVDSPTKPVAVPLSERGQTTRMVTQGERQMVVSQLISLEPPVDESLDAPLRIGQDEESKSRMDPSTVQDLADVLNEMDSGGPAEEEEVPEDYDTGELIEEQSMGSIEQSQPPEVTSKVKLTPEDEKELQELWSMEWPDPGEKPISSNMAQQAESAPPASSGPQEESAPPPQRVIQVESAPQPQDSTQVESGPPGDSEDADGGRLVVNFNPGAQTGPTGFNLTPEREQELQEFWEEGTKDQPSEEQPKEDDDGPKVMEDVAPRGLPPASTHRKFNLTEDDEKTLQEFWEEEPPAPAAEPEQSQPTADGIQLVPGGQPQEEVEVEEFEEELPDGTIRKVIRKRIKRSTVQMVPIEVDPANLPPGGTHNIVVHKKVTKNTVVRDGEEVDTTENVETEIEQDGIVTDAAELRDDLQQLVDQFLSDGTVDGAQIISDEQEVVDESDI
ncbi:hypothetical protein HOLleu_37415 [Holothuria leucospilota]|uniref:Uncharacterized protein n=1 Tax=Holothuria leucospilota TaxID=206669 RepID=A0A9Q1BER3_HOLLE|nr:hypothetical protein HOLleu_37415 [Holothuria leucospilota]